MRLPPGLEGYSESLSSQDSICYGHQGYFAFARFILSRVLPVCLAGAGHPESEVGQTQSLP